MLSSLEAAEYHVKKLGTEFDYGDLVKERLLDEKKVKDFNQRISFLIPYMNELRGITDGNSNVLMEEAFTVLTEGRKKVLKLAKNEEATNADLEAIVQNLYRKLDDIVFVLKDDIHVKDFVGHSDHRISGSISQFIATKFKATRDVTIFQNNMREGTDLLNFKENMETKHEVIAYGTDPDVPICRAAKLNGVDRVAKKGLYKVSHDAFDIALNFIHTFNFYFQGSNERLSEEKDFNFILSRSMVRKDGYIIFNLPYFKIDKFKSRLTRNLMIIGKPYRVDDEMQNVIFVCKNRKLEKEEDIKAQKMMLQRAMLSYEKLPHYTEMQTFEIERGEVVHPKIFRPYFVDKEDIMEAFEQCESSVATMVEYYKPTEDIIDLDRPLQQYKEGHLPAVATSGVVNGIYDTNWLKKFIDVEKEFSNLYLTKIVRQNVVEEREEIKNGEKIRIISEKKRNTIISKLIDSEGEIHTLLETKQ